MPFAFDKAINHRGLSANRSIEHLRSWLWLMERDDLVAFVENNDHYRNYGVPVLKRVAKEFGITLPPKIEAWEDGRACKPGCEEGCNQ